MKQNISAAAPNRRGNALITVVMMVFILMVLLMISFSVSLRSKKETQAGLDDERALLLAEAGLNEGLTAFRAGATGNVGSQNNPVYMGGGIFWVAATDLGGNQAQLTVTSMAGSGRAALEAVVQGSTVEDPLFIATLNSKEPLTLNEDVQIDSFDSFLGDYASQATNTYGTDIYAKDGGDVRSNSDIIMNARATVYGDAVPGPGSTVLMATDTYVSGATVPATEAFAFPEIDVPTLPAAGSVTATVAGSITILPGEYEYTTIDVQKDATLLIQGPTTIVVDDFIGGKDGLLQIDATGGPVTIYVRNSYFHDRGFEADALTGSPMALGFLIDSTQDITFPSSSKIRGAYYAPNANLIFTSSNEAWGSFAANRIDMSSSMQLHYDENLLEHWDDDTGQDGGDSGVLAWREVAVEPAELLRDRRDPLQVLGLVRRELNSPSAGWDVQ